MNVKSIFYLIISAAFLAGCGSSTGSRYEKEEEETKKEEVTEKKPESFDMSPYHSTIDFDVKRESKKEYDIWYGFDSTSQTEDENSTIDSIGFRVEVLTTDDLDEANNMKSEVIFRVKQNAYVIFDPPFYRVRAGDFESRNQAENLSFKLKQLGYPDSRVVSDSIKIRGSR
jgi:hypothetical protein